MHRIDGAQQLSGVDQGLLEDHTLEVTRRRVWAQRVGERCLLPQNVQQRSTAACAIIRGVTLSGRTIARLAQPFEGGDGPSHTQIERIWVAEDASQYLPEGNKADRVMGGL